MKPNYILIILLALLLFALGFYAGRKTTHNNAVIHFLPRQSIQLQLSKEQLKPYKQIIYDTLYLLQHDTLIVLPTPPDTHCNQYLATITDWNTQRLYTNTLLNSDTLGKITYNATLQYNQLQDFSIQFTPIQKTIQQIKERIFIPFVGIGYSSLPLQESQTLHNMNLQAGMFYKQWGAEVQLHLPSPIQQLGWGVNVKYRF